MSNETYSAPGFCLQEFPATFCAKLPGGWLLKHTTPAWRIKEPLEGFQRMVNERRTRAIAVSVLDQHRTFPNAIVLATDIGSIVFESGNVVIPEDVVFLVVDGQHRLWAQHYSKFKASYACVIHTCLSQEEMAALFLEINDNQKRVPSSLRWDLVRLIKPEDNPIGVASAEMVYMLATEKESPFFQRIDLTGEQSEMQIKQGSLAPEIETLLRSRAFREYPFEEQYRIFLEYSIAIQQADSGRWGSKESPFFKARVLRSMVRLLPDLIRDVEAPNSAELTVMIFLPYLRV